MNLLKAKAKINLFFHITGKRSDGYHLIERLNVFAEDIYDTIEINADYSDKTKVIGGEFASVMANEQNNLIDVAIKKFFANEQLNCRIIKDIPIGAGLGGGSADAAVVLKYLNPHLTDLELAQIGADLPICYYSKSTYCKGIGEILEPVQNLPEMYLVLVNPRKSLLTKNIFAFNKKTNTAPILDMPKNFSQDLQKFIEFLSDLSNDLTCSAIEMMPEISCILSLLEKEQNCKIARMSGSGPTCFGIFENRQDAIEASKNILQLHQEYWVKVTSI